MMVRDQIAQEVNELRAEAAEARALAATFKCSPSRRDLLNYAEALEREAAQLESNPAELLPSAQARCLMAM